MLLRELLSRLDDRTAPVPIDELVAWLEALVIDPQEVQPCVRFSDAGYQRNLLKAGPGYHALILCWKPGQRSPIHDHRGSSCGVRVLRGVMTETVFDRTPEGWIYPTHTRQLAEGGVCGSHDADIHQVSNLQPDRELITLHIYTPPLLTMGVYSLDEPGVRTFTDPVGGLIDGSGI